MTEKGSKTGDRMTDERKDRTEAMEQLTPEELAKEIEKNKRKVARNIVFIMAAIVAFIAICIAWFVSNNRVNGVLGGISAKKSGIEIGSKGRGGVHDDLLKKIVDGITYFPPKAGVKEKYDTSQGGSINWLLGEDSNMKNYNNGNAFNETEGKLRKDYAMEPGTKGKLDFFIKSYEGGNLSLNFTLDIAPYTRDEKTVGKDSIAAQLLSGHILYFLGEKQPSEKQSGETIKYTWIKDGTFHIEIKNAKADMEYDYSIYWVWPLNLSTILLNTGDEFLNGNAVEFDDKDSTGTLRNEIIADMQTHPGRYFFSSLTGGQLDANYAEVGEISNIHSNSGQNAAGTYNKQLFVDLSSYYNQADMKIGSEISFIRATLEYTGPSETTTKTTEANNEG